MASNHIENEHRGTELPSQRRNAFSKFYRNAKYGVSALALMVLLGTQVYPPLNAFANSESSGPVQAQDIGPKVPSFAPLVERVKPAVVSIRVKSDASAKLMGDQSEEGGPSNGENPFKGTPFEHFFQGPNSPFHHFGPSAPGEQHHPVMGQGSGFFISADGDIVTNNHVVDGATSVEVVTDSGDTYKAKVVGTDPRTDIALVKVESNKTFPYVKLSQNDVKVGDWVVAMGNPFGLGGTVTAGIVSARSRDIGMGSYDDFIQIDAPVNRGNSGGPSFNQDGEVIGVNTAIFSPSGGSVGIAFDIPASTVQNIVAQLKDHGYVTRGWLGVKVQPVTSDIADSLGLKEPKGALVAAPQEGSPADKAGIKKGDVIQEVNGQEIKDGRDLARKIAALAPNTNVRVTVLSNGNQKTVNLKLGRLPDEPIKKTRLSENKSNSGTELGSLGLSVAPAGDVGSGDQGVAIVRIDPNGKAADLGLNQGDVILKANGKDLSSPADLAHALDHAKDEGKKHALVLIRRGDNQIYVALPTELG